MAPAIGRTPRRRAAALLLRVLVLVLAFPLASSGALPLWAQLAGVEGPHICQCGIKKHDCLCAKCDPEHEEDLLFTTESLTGRCGDDETVFGGKAICAVLAAPVTFVPFATRPLEAASEAALVPVPPPEPPTPPPRSSSSPVT